MIKIEKTQVVGLEPAIRGMRNPMNSWNKSDSVFDIFENGNDFDERGTIPNTIVGDADHDLMKRLAKNGSVHAKYRRMIVVYCDITAPLYWWKEFDTYKVGTVANSCSTMHKIHAKEFTLDDFSHEHLITGTEPYDEESDYCFHDCNLDRGEICAEEDVFYEERTVFPYDILKSAVIPMLNECRNVFLKTKDKRAWWQMIQLLPSSYNQKRTIMFNYEVLAGIYPMRKDHKLDEWHEFCDWIKGLPYSELITLEFEEEEKEKPALDSIDDNVHVHLPKNSGRYPWGKKED